MDRTAILNSILVYLCDIRDRRIQQEQEEIKAKHLVREEEAKLCEEVRKRHFKEYDVAAAPILEELKNRGHSDEYEQDLLKDLYKRGST